MTDHTPTPVLFLSHGAPTFALEPGALGPVLNTLGRQLTGLRAVLVISPHWQTREIEVTTHAQPDTIHDFGGFPASLYALRYPAPGQPELAAEAIRLLGQAGLRASANASRGLDHGAWVPLWHLLPQAQVPVFQVSMPRTLDTAQALALGRALAPLRAQGVLIVGSGSMTHNLYEVRQPGSAPQQYAAEFAAWVRAAVLAGDADALRNYRSVAPYALRAHPTEEHFLPLLAAFGATAAGETVRPLEGGITYGVLAMDGYLWGDVSTAGTGA